MSPQPPLTSKWVKFQFWVICPFEDQKKTRNSPSKLKHTQPCDTVTLARPLHDLVGSLLVDSRVPPFFFFLTFFNLPQQRGTVYERGRDQPISSNRVRRALSSQDE